MLRERADETPEVGTVETFSLNSKWFGEGDSLLQARSYSRGAFHALDAIERSGLTIATFGECVARIYHLTENQARSNFKRIWTDEGQGPPYLSPKEMFHLRPSKERFLSPAIPKLEEMLVPEGWLLLSRSGTTGYPVLVNQTLSQFAVSDDVLRIVPDACPVGYLYAFLSSRYGNALATRDEYGKTVKHLEAKHIASIPVPMAERREQLKVHGLILQAYNLRDEANALLNRALDEVHRVLDLAPFNLGDVEYLGEDADPRAFEVNSSHLGGRLDASNHIPAERSAIRRLKTGAYRTVPLHERVEEIDVAPRFARNYVEEAHGIPFLQGRQVPQMRPQRLQFLSRLHTSNLERWLVHEGTVLVTCSGTIGRVGYVSSAFDGWAASQHILRIVPREKESHAGFLVAFLMSGYGHWQVIGKAYGGVVEELTAEDMGSLQVPDVPWRLQSRVGQFVMEAFAKRDQASALEDAAIERIERLIVGG